MNVILLFYVEVRLEERSVVMIEMLLSEVKVGRLKILEVLKWKLRSKSKWTLNLNLNLEKRKLLDTIIIARISSTDLLKYY